MGILRKVKKIYYSKPMRKTGRFLRKHEGAINTGLFAASLYASGGGAAVARTGGRMAARRFIPFAERRIAPYAARILRSPGWQRGIRWGRTAARLGRSRVQRKFLTTLAAAKAARRDAIVAGRTAHALEMFPKGVNWSKYGRGAYGRTSRYVRKHAMADAHALNLL